jgi:hypothetical protein
LFGGIVAVGGPGVEDPARREFAAKRGEIACARIVRVLRVFLRVEVIEVAEELVEAVHRRQESIQIAEVVLAELASRVAEWLEQLRDRGVLVLQSD